jgi:phosphatidylglycerol:prolipoprotein diacylglycerol transferase
VYPILLHSGHLFLPTFGVLAAVGLMLALTMSQRTAVWVGLDPEAVWNAGLFAVIAAFVFSRVLLVVENFTSFLQYPLLLLAVPSLTATGLLATLVATLVWLRLHRLPVLPVLDAWAPCATLTWSFLALGHFAEGSDPGMAATFGVRMPGESTPLHPVAVYVALYALAITVGLLARLRRPAKAGSGPAGTALAMGLVGAGAGQFLLGFLRQPDVSGVTTLLDPLQWVAAGMMWAGGMVFLLMRPGTSLDTEYDLKQDDLKQNDLNDKEQEKVLDAL